MLNLVVLNLSKSISDYHTATDIMFFLQKINDFVTFS